MLTYEIENKKERQYLRVNVHDNTADRVGNVSVADRNRFHVDITSHAVVNNYVPIIGRGFSARIHLHNTRLKTERLCVRRTVMGYFFGNNRF